MWASTAPWCLPDAISRLSSTSTRPSTAALSGPAWNATPMQLYLSAMEQGQLYHFAGASGDISFDADTYTTATATTYVYWQLMDGKIYHRSYFGNLYTTGPAEFIRYIR